MVFVQTEKPTGYGGPGRHRETGHAREWQRTGHLAAARHKAGRILPPVFTASADFSFQQDEQPIRRIALVQQNVSGREGAFFRARHEPLQLVVAKVREDVNGTQ